MSFLSIGAIPLWGPASSVSLSVSAALWISFPVLSADPRSTLPELVRHCSFIYSFIGSL